MLSRPELDPLYGVPCTGRNQAPVCVFVFEVLGR